MSASPAVAILPLLLFLLVAFGALTALGFGVALWLRGRKRQQEAGGACGKCGYSTRGLSTFACPECGADLREVGIVQPAKPATPLIAILIIAGALGVFVILCCGGLFTFRMVGGTSIKTFPPPPSATVAVTPAPTTAPATQPAPLPPEAPGNPR